jgi:FkbM family methyltransferase
MRPTLTEIILQKTLVTDKHSLHAYTDNFYEIVLAPYRDQPVQIVEIGFDQGGSLMLWAEWFSQAKILGIDLQFRGNCQQDCARYPNIQISLGNAYDMMSLPYYPRADIVIDDGSHDPDHQVWCVKNLTHKINPGGILIIEDVVSLEVAEKLREATPFHLREYVEIVDLRHIKQRLDDILFVIRIPAKTGTVIQPSKPISTARSASVSIPGSDMMSERLSHLQGKIDFTSVKNIIDVGSAHGYESINLARNFPNARVWGFEPYTEHYNHCLKVQQEYPLLGERIRYHPLALNNLDGPMTFYPLDEAASRGNNTGMASKFRLIDPAVFPHELSIQRETTVNAVTLDTWCEENRIAPEILWMDVQGAELDVLSGAARSLHSVKAILTEVGISPYYHGHTLKPNIDAFLSVHGFRELVSARKTGHQYEMDTIYIRD